MIAIHHREGSFSENWIVYCEDNNIDYKLVNCYSSSIISDLNGCAVLMWHWHHNNKKDIVAAKSILISLEYAGVNVFPDPKTCWHFDDKLAQKYLLEAIDAPLVNSYVFFDKKEAFEWISNTNFPKVFKLRGGAGAENVKKVKDKKDARYLVKKSFGSGFLRHPRSQKLSEGLWRFKRKKNLKSIVDISKGMARIFISSRKQKELAKEKGYIYFQDFIPDNTFDIRVIVIGERAFAIKRMVRDGDFRASGSGYIKYDKSHIPDECVEIAFKVSSKLGTQSLAYDFVYDGDEPKIIEISYAFTSSAYRDCPGYWDSSLKWHEGTFIPEYFMIEDVIKGSLNKTASSQVA